MHRLIGGFLPLRMAESAREASILNAWTSVGPAKLLHNARSALNALWGALSPTTIWLPAYVCIDVAASVPAQCAVRYYPLDASLRPDIGFLDGSISPGDHVLAVDYFGRPQGADFLALRERWTDVGWVQDCAHALEGHVNPWGDWLVFSPRKLIGVPDGGVLVARTSELPTFDTYPLADFGFIRPALHRFEDTDDSHHQQCYAEYVDAERAQCVGALTMSRMSVAILDYAKLERDALVRRRNYETLRARLAQWAFLGEGPIDFAPMGFPVRGHSGLVLVSQLAMEGIFAPRHWATLPSSAMAFPDAHALARRLVTLPCDYRYDEADMRRVGEVAARLLSANDD